MDFDLFVIGGGSAGVRCARISAGYGARVAIAEARHWGGTCVNIGCVPKKIMVQAAEYRGAFQDARAFGWDLEVRGHNWAALKARRDAEVARLSGLYRHLLEAAGVTLFEGHAALIDAHTVEIGERRVTAHVIVIATGGEPIRPTIPGAEHCLVSDDLFALSEKPERVVVLGGGYVACEFSSLLNGLGVEVHQLYRGPLFLRGFDRDIREALAEEMRAEGIDLRFDADAERIEKTREGFLVVSSDGRTIEADAVFATIGRRPNVAGLGLGRAGVHVTARGAIMVDEAMQTSVPSIFALGDVTDRLNLTPVATAQGHALADTLFGGRPRRVSLENVPTAVFTIPPIGTVGLTEEEAAKRGPIDVYLARFRPLRHTITGRQRRTLIKLLVERANGRVLGAHMLGEDAPEIIQGIAITLVMGATKADFDRTIGVHPTAAEEFVTLRSRRPDPLAEAAD